MWTRGSGSKSTKLYIPKEGGGAVLHLGPWIIPVSRAKGSKIIKKKKVCNYLVGVGGKNIQAFSKFLEIRSVQFLEMQLSRLV